MFYEAVRVKTHVNKKLEFWEKLLVRELIFSGFIAKTLKITVDYKKGKNIYYTAIKITFKIINFTSIVQSHTMYFKSSEWGLLINSQRFSSGTATLETSSITVFSYNSHFHILICLWFSHQFSANWLINSFFNIFILFQ